VSETSVCVYEAAIVFPSAQEYVTELMTAGVVVAAVEVAVVEVLVVLKKCLVIAK
jgi:hypothetical protein